ncbi:MAG: DUF2845 domain-containing protein [Xanthomonadales bacterium]|jgi:hypothetical protein|nr:DUF2845 domain-containing protein [Xanthomonadales bacterium]MDH3923894.1 DUF2845 domain-containing protein [Xanthomonadales bacterium]MDH3940995.1 DUF2845 domain-containing protein [Xanthomonadales bacterium]MDH4001484.1 DUF2845 domain-containing protein [Xanthomonadales bacterium]
MRKSRQFALSLILILACASVALADSFRCGRKLIRTGDSSGELIRLCGEPYHKDRGRARLDIDGINRNVSIERWHYKKSSRSLEHIIVVHQGIVQQVIVGGR